MIKYHDTKRSFLMKKILTMIISICVIFILIGLLPVHGEAEVYDSVIRLHVIANSDSDEDQALKLSVRDRIIEMTKEIGSGCTSLEDAEKVMREHLDDIRACADNEVKRLGYNYSVEVRLGEEEYPTKTYASLCFPSGKYLSLQILIGEASGQNWWCVLFPPLCLDAAQRKDSNEDAFISVGLTSEQYKIITETQEPTYQARFKLLEIFEKAIE